MSLRVCTVSTDPDSEAALARLLDGFDGTELFMRCTDRIGTLGAIRSGLVSGLLIVGAPSWLQSDVAEEARTAGISLLGLTNDPFEAEFLLGLGCILVGLEADPETILAALSSPAGASAPPLPKGHGEIVAVWGPRGAPGVTSVAIEMACLLAQREPRTLMIDADPYGGDCLQAFGVEEELASLVWACRTAERDPKLLLAGLKRIGSQGPVFVPGLPHPGSWAEISAASWSSLREEARKAFEKIVVDAGSCLEEGANWQSGDESRNELTRAAVEDADQVLAVIEGSAKGLKRFAESWPDLRSIIGERSPSVIVNRSRPQDRSEITRMIFQQVGMEPACFLPEDRYVGIARRRGRPLTELRPRSPFVRAISEILPGGVPSRSQLGFMARLGGVKA